MFEQVFNPANYDLTVFALPPLLVGLLTAALGVVVVFRERRSSLSLAFFIMTSVASVRLLSYFPIYSTTHEQAALWWARFENAAVILIPSSVYLFTLALVNRLKTFRWAVFGSLMISTLFLVINVSSDDFVEGTYVYPWGFYARYAKPWTFFFLAFFFLLVLESMRLYWAAYHTYSGVKKRRLQALLAGFCIAYFGSVDYLAAYGIPVYPFGYIPVSIFLILAARGVGRYRLGDITPSYAAEQIIRTMNDGLLVIDQEGIVRVANQAASVLFCQPDLDLAGKPVSVLGLDFFKKENLARVICTGKVQNQELVFRNPSGENILEISTSVIRDSENQNRQAAIVCVVKDVTDRKQAEKALKECEKKYNLLAENMTEVVWTMNVKMEMMYVSPSISQFRGLSVEDAMKENFEQGLSPESRKIAMKAIAEELAPERTVRRDPLCSRVLELEFLSKNGTTVWAEVKLTLLCDKKGMPLGFLGIAHDIAERRRAAETLEESGRCYTELLQDTAEPVILLDRLGYFQLVNPAAENTLGYHADELMGKHIAKTGIVAAESIAKTLQEFTLILLGWQRSPFELHLVRKDHAQLVMEASSKLVRREKENARVQVTFHEVPIHKT